MLRPRPSGFVEPSYPELVALDHQLRRRRPKGVPNSLNGLSAVPLSGISTSAEGRFQPHLSLLDLGHSF